MAYPIDNFGDYNVVRNDLKDNDGNADILYQKIGAAAVAKERPKIFKAGFKAGGLTVIGIIGIVMGSYSIISHCKNKKNEKKALKAEPKLKEELTKTIENTSVKTEIDENPHQN